MSSSLHICPNFGCKKQYSLRSSLFNHAKNCPYQVHARNKHRLVTVLDDDQLDYPPQPKLTTRTRSNSEKTELELMEFVNATGVMDEFAKLPVSKIAPTRAVMGMCDNIEDNEPIANVKRGLKRAQNEVLFHEYGLLLRTHEKALTASLNRQRAEQEDTERRRKAKYDKQMSILKDDLDAGTPEPEPSTSSSSWGIHSLFGK